VNRMFIYPKPRFADGVTSIADQQDTVLGT
jgi:hypothetical protein